jgi:hypothetical protein
MFSVAKSKKRSSEERKPKKKKLWNEPGNREEAPRTLGRRQNFN